MKALIVTFLCCVVALPAQPVGDLVPYRIEGTIDGSDDADMIYLAIDEAIPNEEKLIIDSSSIDQGRFMFKGEAKLGMHALFIKKSKQWKKIFLDGQDISLKMSADSLHSALVEGSDEMNIINQIETRLKPLKLQEMNLFNQLLRLKKAGNTDSIKLLTPEFKQIQSHVYSVINQHIKNFPTSYASLELMAKHGDKIMQKEIALGLIDNFPEKFRQLDIYERALNKYTPKLSTVGESIVDFILPDTIGTLIDSRKYRSGYLLIDFWASWCVPCRQEHPNLIKAYNKFGGEGFEILSVSIDQDTLAWKEAIRKDKLTWQQVISGIYDPQIRNYPIDKIPASFLFDPEGKIVAVNLRGDSLINFLVNKVRSPY